MHHVDEMRAWIGFDDRDAELLTTLWPHVEPRRQDIADRFYERILASPEARQVLVDLDQVSRLKGTLERWVRQLLLGPFDATWAAHQRRIGEVHVMVGLQHRYMFTAMTVLRDQLCEMASAADLPDCRAVCRAVGRVCDIALALMTGRFLDAHEQVELASLRDLLVSHLPAGVLVVDHQGHVRTATRSAVWLSEATPVNSSHYLEVIPRELVEAAELPVQVEHARRSGHTVTLLRVEVRLGGRTRTFRIDIVPFQHPIADFLIHLEELTPMVEAEARAQRSEALARLGALSAAVAHELRNPLAGISGALQILNRSLPAGDDRVAIMGQIINQVRRLDALVSDLLAFARPRQPTVQTVDLGACVDEVGRLVQQAHPRLRVDIQGDGRAVADPDHVHRILLNLATNAAQATRGEGHVTFDVTDGRVDVRDDGPGVPEEERERIFQPFYTTRTQGTGLGLAICAQSAESMRGEVRLLSPAESAGATFRLTLPERA